MPDDRAPLVDAPPRPPAPAGAWARPAAAVPAQVGRGFVMGSADLVPGVSGGTMALVLGIYVPLVEQVGDAASAVGRLVKGDPRAAVRAARALDWWFLVPLFAGIVLALITLAGPLSRLLEDRPVVMSAAFFGLIVGSILVSLDRVSSWDLPRTVVFAGVTGLTFWGLGLRGGSMEDPALVILFLGGAVAACAMILPGISGSFILLMIGLYQYVLTAVHERHVLSVAVVAVGAVTGLGLFSAALTWLLDHHRDTLMAALIGLMAGSLRVLWMWPADEGGIGDTRLGTPVAEDVVVVVVACLLGAAAVTVLALLGRRRESLAEPRRP